MVMKSLEKMVKYVHRRKIHLQAVLVLCVLVAVYNYGAYVLRSEDPINSQTRRHGQAEDSNGRPDIEGIDIDLMSLPPFTFDPAYKNPCWRQNGVLRCLPFFYMVGVKKCGTTELYKLIAKHPDYITPDGNKEPGWFAWGRFDKKHAAEHTKHYIDHPHYSFDFYIDLFSNVAQQIDSEINERQEQGQMRCSKITGDGSTSNIEINTYWPYLPGNEGLEEPRYIILDYIHNVLPKSKIIIMFRNPVERLYSDYYYRFIVNQVNYTSSPEHFHEEASGAVRKYTNCFKTRTVRSCIYDDRIISSLRNGIYSVYWRDLTRVFPKEQILIVHMEELQDIRSILIRVFKFLEMRIPDSSEWNSFVGIHWNSRTQDDIKKGDMLTKTRTLLENFYRPFNEEMFRATGDKTFLYN